MFCHTRNQRNEHRAQRLATWFFSWGYWSAGCLLLLATWTQTFGQVSVLDSSFKVGSGADGPVDALLVQADQRILVGGEFASINGCSNSFLARLNSDGSVDTSFNSAGQTDGFVECLLQQPDRKVLVGGAFGRVLGQPRAALARLLEDGSVDATFDASSALTTNAQDLFIGLAGRRPASGWLLRVGSIRVPNRAA